MDNLKAVNSALGDIDLLEQEGEDGNEDKSLQLLASGGYNNIWLVSRPLQDARQYVIRKPKEDALLPDQIRNEVAFLTFVRQDIPGVPVPQVYSHSLDGEACGRYFIAEEFIDGQVLSSVWNTYDEPTKWAVSRQIAEMVVKLGETEFDKIGGMMLDHELGPTVEGIKLFKGRDKFHSSDFYDIGPYKSAKAYVLACYDKEIYYYSHASEEDIDQDLFEDISKDDFIKTLQDTRRSIAEDDKAFALEEPFVLVHGDFHGRNIMMKDGRIAAIIDWEFAGSDPLSELLGGVGVDVLELESDEDVEENNKWSEVIVKLAGEIARSKGWDDKKLELLLGDGNPDLQRARVEMFPFVGAASEDSPI